MKKTNMGKFREAASHFKLNQSSTTLTEVLLSSFFRIEVVSLAAVPGQNSSCKEIVIECQLQG